MNFIDSGVETGNDSNDSSVIQHDNLVAMTSVDTSDQNQSNVSNVSAIFTSSSGNANGIIKEVDSSNEIISSPAATGQESLPGAVVDTLQSTPNNSLVSVSMFNKSPFESITFDSRNLFSSSSVSDMMVLQFQIPPMFGHDCSLPGSSVLKTKLRAITDKTKSSINRRKQLFHRFDFKSSLNERKMRLAAATNNIDIVQRLLDEGVSPNNWDEHGRSPLHLASCRGYTEMVKLLLTYGADPNRRDSIGNTPLHLATVTSKISVVTLLLMAGTDVLSSDSHGHNPLQLAQTKLRLIQNCKGADMNAIKDEVRNIIGMLLAYLQKQKDAREQVEALSSLCSRLSLSNSSDQIKDDVRNLLANLDSLSITN